MGTSNEISESSVCNLALARAGSTQTITTLLDGSNEANQCAIWYPQLRDTMLCEFPWPWARGYAPLSQVAGPEIDGQRANAEWLRAYRYPTDCLKIRALLPTQAASSSGAAFPGDADEWWLKPEGRPYPYPYTLSQDETSRLILTDAVGYGYGLTCVYTRAVSDPAQFAADFADALAWRLAADLCSALQFSSERRKECHEEYMRHTQRARANHMNETQGANPSASRYRTEGIRRRWTW